MSKASQSPKSDPSCPKPTIRTTLTKAMKLAEIAVAVGLLLDKPSQSGSDKRHGGIDDGDMSHRGIPQRGDEKDHRRSGYDYEKPLRFSHLRKTHRVLSGFSTKAATAITAAPMMPRQASSVHLSSGMRRVKNPAVLHATVKAVTSRSPVRQSDHFTGPPRQLFSIHRSYSTSNLGFPWHQHLSNDWPRSGPRD